MEEDRGLLVGIEGVDAVGKRTQSTLLLSWLRSKSIASNVMSFPDYGTVIGREIKNYLMGNRSYSARVGHMLYAINRWERKEDLEKMLSESEVVVVNRYSASNFAYGMARGLELEWLKNLEEGLPLPDLVLVLDAPPSALTTRRGPLKDTYERSIELQEKVRKAYFQLSKEMGWKVIDAAQGIQSTHQLMVSTVTELLTSRGRTV